MQSNRSTRNAHMPFDDLTSTQEVPFAPSPVRKADLVWQMPEPSNPGLRSLISNAEQDSSSRANPTSYESNWGFPPLAVTSNPPAFNHRTSHRAYPKRSNSSTFLETNKALAQLTDPHYMMNVANFANQRAKERSKEFGEPVVKRVKVSQKPNKSEKSKGLNVVASGKVRKRSDAQKKLKRKEISNATGAFIQPMFDDDSSIATSSSTSPSTSEILDDSMSVDTSFSIDAALHAVSPTKSDTKKHSSMLPIIVTPCQSTRSAPMGHTSIQMAKASDPAIKLHPLLLSDGKSTQADKSTHRPITHSVLSPQFEPPVSVQPPRQAAIPPSMSFPRPSSKPPVLGMRRTATLPAKITAIPADTRDARATIKKELPTKQRPFKTPFLPPTQRPSDKHGQPTDTVPDRSCRRSSPLARRTQSRRPETEDPDSSYGDDSFDMEALEETLKKYD